MEQRGQFTFYRSFWEAVQDLPKKDRLPILEAIISYALDGTVPAGMTKGQSAFFSLVKPNLDSARKKASSGKQGGSKTKANSKQAESKKENEIEKENKKENENENEIEIEGEKDKEQTPSIGSLFEAFWNNYPDKRDRDGAEEAWYRNVTDVPTAYKMLVELDAWKDSAQWNDQNGAFVPMASNWLNKGYWMNPPVLMVDNGAIAWEGSGTEALYHQLMSRRG